MSIIGSVIHNMKFCFFLILAFLVVNTANANDYHFKSLTVNNGLSQNDISAICQDSYGFIWIGTYDGLNKFDGFSIESFQKISNDSNSLPENRITALAEDHKKRLWIGTQGGSIAYYSLLQQRFFRIKTSHHSAILEILTTNSGEVFATTPKGILKLVDSSEPTFEILETSKTFHFNAAKEDSKGTIFFAGQDGIFTYENNFLRQVKNPNNIQFTSLCFDQSNNLIAGSYKGLFILRNDSLIEKVSIGDVPNNQRINSIIKDKHQNIWIGTNNLGLVQLDSNFNIINQVRATEPLETRGLLSNTVIDLYCDETNNLWVGSRQGLCYTDLNNVGFQSLKLESLSRPNVRNIHLEENLLLLGISHYGLFQYDLNTKKLERISRQEIDYVRQISKSENQIFVSSNYGLFVSDQLPKFKKYEFEWLENTSEPRDFTCFVKDDFNRIYLGTPNGIVVIEDRKAKWISNNEIFQGARIFNLHYQKDQSALYVGTISKGLFALSLDKNGNWLTLEQIQLYNANSSPLASTSIWSFHHSNDGALWLGTDAGLFKKEYQDSLFKQIAVDGVIDKKIMSIVEGNEGYLWLSNSQGLIRYDPKTGSTRLYNYNDGLLSSTLTEGAAVDSNNRLYFGTAEGVNFIDVENLPSITNHQDIVISKFKVHNQTVFPNESYFGSVILEQNINSTERIELDHLQNNFTIEFSGNNYSNVHGSTFKYKLEGYDRNWKLATHENRVISYSNLRPGDYQLMLDVEVQDGSGAKNPRSIEIRIVPAPWKTIWAYAIYIFIVVSILAIFIYFWNNRQKLNHQIELDKMVINRDQELREMQLRFFTDMAHEFKTPLSLIIAPINDLMHKSLDPEVQKMCFQIVARNIQRMNVLISQLLDYGRITEGDKSIQVSQANLMESIQDIVLAFQWQTQKDKIAVRINGQQCMGYFDPDILEKALFNVLSNAFKHTPENGTIEISLEMVGHSAKIVLDDSGPGIPNDLKPHIFDRFFHGTDRVSSGIGLHLTKRLIETHKGSISVSDSHLGGACFTISIPIDKSYYAPKELIYSPIKSEKLLFEYDENPQVSITDVGETILIVEDDPDLRQYLKLTLQTHYIIYEASNGEKGLEVARRELPDIIITDVMMPIMNGIELCEKIKKDSNTSHIPILMLTAKTGSEYEKIGLGAGAWDYIAKPFDSSALLLKVNNIIDTRNKFKTYLSDQNINLEIKSHYTSFDQKLIERVTDIIKLNLQNPEFSVNELAHEVGLSRMHLHRKLKTLVGESGKSIITKVKIKHATSMFDQGCDRIQEAMDAVGINGYANFNNNFKRVMNMTATEYVAQLKERQP